MVKSIIEDNVEEFEKKFEKYISDCNVCIGSYPLLSVLYIYNAKRILTYYEELLIENYNAKQLCFDEDILIYKKLAAIAKLNCIEYKKAKNVSPVEILVLKGNYKKAKFLSKIIKLDNEQQIRIKNILEKNNIGDKYNIDSEINYSDKFYKKRNNQRIICVFMFIVYICAALISVLSLSSSYKIYIDNICISSYRLFGDIDYDLVKADVKKYDEKYNNNSFIIIGPFIDNEHKVLYADNMENVKTFYFKKVLYEDYDPTPNPDPTPTPDPSDPETEEKMHVLCVVFVYEGNKLSSSYTVETESISSFTDSLETEYKANELEYNPTTGYWETRILVSGPYGDSQFTQSYYKGAIAYYRVVKKW